MINLPFTRNELRVAADACKRSDSHVSPELLERIIAASKVPQKDGVTLTPVEARSLIDALDREGRNESDPAKRAWMARAFIRLSQAGVPRLEHGPSVKLEAGK